jgi:hypothetical protein
MTWRFVLFSVICAASLSYLAIANATGYVPFAAQKNHTSNGTANYFHK